MSTLIYKNFLFLYEVKSTLNWNQGSRHIHNMFPIYGPSEVKGLSSLARMCLLTLELRKTIQLNYGRYEYLIETL